MRTLCERQEWPVRISELGEFELIRRLTEGLESRPDVLLAAGDDAALLDTGAGDLLVATVDAQVEGRHFLRSVATPQEIGHKALAVNLSDIASMGAEPLWALVSLVTPPTLDESVLDGIYAGMRALARRYGVAIVGGNVAATDGPLTLDLTVLGRVGRGRALVRSGGKPGDIVLITGALGAAAAGVLVATQPAPVGSQLARETANVVHASMVTPTPRVEAGRALAATGVVTAMLDVSDGLAADVGHLCAASGVGVTLEAEAIPVSAAAEAVARAYGREPLALALTGGEDYELLFSVRPDGIQEALAAVTAQGTEVHVIGQLTDAGHGMRLQKADGSLQPLERRGWDHLRAETSETGGTGGTGGTGDSGAAT
jgi:thiamine-monophosphate kinase